MRKMKGYVILTNLSTRDREELTKWTSRSLEYARALPPKKKTAKTAAKKARRKT